jgi:hypothetical protein
MKERKNQIRRRVGGGNGSPNFLSKITSPIWETSEAFLTSFGKVNGYSMAATLVDQFVHHAITGTLGVTTPSIGIQILLITRRRQKADTPRRSFMVS